MENKESQLRKVPETKRLLLGSALGCWEAAVADGGGLKEGKGEVEKSRLKPRCAATALIAIIGLSLKPLDCVGDKINRYIYFFKFPGSEIYK